MQTQDGCGPQILRLPIDLSLPLPSRHGSDCRAGAATKLDDQIHTLPTRIKFSAQQFSPNSRVTHTVDHAKNVVSRVGIEPTTRRFAMRRR